MLLHDFFDIKKPKVKEDSWHGGGNEPKDAWHSEAGVAEGLAQTYTVLAWKNSTNDSPDVEELDIEAGQARAMAQELKAEGYKVVKIQKQGVAEDRIETIHGSAYTIDPSKYYVWAWDNAVVLYGEYTDENDAKLSLSKIERRATKRLGPAVKGRFEVASGKMLLRQYGDEQGVAEGLPGEFIGGTAGGVGGAVVGAAVGGPIGAVVGGAAGGTAGQIAGRELTDEQKLNEFGPFLVAGARLFMAAAPKIAQVFGKVGQAGARGVGQAAKAGAGIAAKNAGQIGIGAGAYEIGSSVADIVKDITAKVGAAVDEKTIFDLATLAFKYAIPAGIVLAILYGGKKAIDSLFADPKTPQGVAEARHVKLQKMRELCESLEISGSEKTAILDRVAQKIKNIFDKGVYVAKQEGRELGSAVKTVASWKTSTPQQKQKAKDDLSDLGQFVLASATSVFASKVVLGALISNAVAGPAVTAVAGPVSDLAKHAVEHIISELGITGIASAAGAMGLVYIKKVLHDASSTSSGQRWDRMQTLKQRPDYKPMAGPKGQLPEQGVAEGSGSNSRALRIAEKIWAKYGSPKNEDRIYPENLIDLVDAAAGGRTYFFRSEIEAVPGVKTIMASINGGKFYDRAKFDKGVAILLKAAPKSRFGESAEQGVAEGSAEDNLNELDKSTLGSYVKKAAADVNTKSRDAQQHKDMWAGDYPVRGAKKQARQNQADIDKRIGGISRAVDRLAAEDVAEGRAPSVIQKIRDNISVDEISKDREGNLIFRRGFFYTNNGSAEQFAARIDNELTNLNIPHTIVDKGQVWRPFKGGATTKSQSHWWVKVKISQPSVAEADKKRNPTRDFLRKHPVPDSEMVKPVKKQGNQDAKTSLSHMMGGSSNELMKNLKIKEQGVSESINYWNKLQDTRNKKINSLVDELEKSIK